MHNFRKVVLVLLALVLMFSAMGVTAQPAQASGGCRAYHWVRYGETLAWIGRAYGVSWPYLASVNGIPRPYTIYSGQRLCIPYGYGYPTGGQPSGQFVSAVGLQRTWSFAVTDVVPNTSVTIHTSNFPSNVWFSVRMGRMQANGRYLWVKLPIDQYLDSDRGGNFSQVFPMPLEMAGASQMALRLIQEKKNGKTMMQDVVFWNVAGGQGGYRPTYHPVYPPGHPPCYGHPPCWGVIPTIWISSVVRNNTVTITTHNWPAGVNFAVYMGPMGTRGIGGIPVGNLYSGAGGTLTATFPIPPQLYGSQQIAIRTQNWPTGYYSYNWFYNNTAY